MKNKILLVDGNLLLFKSFYSVFLNKVEYKNSNGIDTRTIHRFFKSLLTVIKQLSIEFCFIAFDAHGDNKRKELYSEYKAGRTKPDPIIFEYKKYILKILDELNLFWFEKIGDEADDLIASIRDQLQGENNDFFVFSDDQDLLQLIDDNTRVVKKNSKEKKYEEINVDNFISIFDFDPIKIVDFKAISGDSSDNLPGIKGVGKMGAKKLLKEYNTLENIYENIDSLPLSLKNKFIENKEMSFLCKKLAKLNHNVDLSFIKINDLKINHNYNDSSFKTLEELELKNIISEILNNH
ncbi:MAG: 5'-3' exonuclease [Metamycoplasmataceae bacterium]